MRKWARDRHHCLRAGKRRYNHFEMIPISVKTRLASLFILTFLCLNAGGAVCLAYCESASAQDAQAEHCPLKKATPDCHHSAQQSQPSTDAATLESESVTCCTLAINVFIAPIERKQVDQEIAAVVLHPSAVVGAEFLLRTSNAPQRSIFVGPQLDRRVERIRHRVFRI